METELQPQRPKTSLSKDEAIQTLQAMFPSVDRDVIAEILYVNGNRMQKTIDSLLQITLEPTTTPTTTSTTSTTPSETTTTTPTSEQTPPTPQPPTTPSHTETIKPSREQLADDEILARSLQAQWSTGEGNLDDERLAADMARMEKDEMLARQLQRQEVQSAENIATATLYGYPTRNKRYGSQTWPSDSDSTDTEEEPGEPIATQIDKKLTEIGKDIKSGWSSFTSIISQAFTPTPPPTPKAPSKIEPVPPASQAVYSPLFEKDQEEGELVSSDDEGLDDHDDNSLIDKRTERKNSGNVVLTINTE